MREAYHRIRYGQRDGPLLLEDIAPCSIHAQTRGIRFPRPLDVVSFSYSRAASRSCPPSRFFDPPYRFPSAGASRFGHPVFLDLPSWRSGLWLPPSPRSFGPTRLNFAFPEKLASPVT